MHGGELKYFGMADTALHLFRHHLHGMRHNRSAQLTILPSMV